MPAVSLMLPHTVFSVVMGRVGSRCLDLPKGNKYHSGLTIPKRVGRGTRAPASRSNAAVCAFKRAGRAVRKTGVVTVVETVVTMGKKQPKTATNGNNRKECLGRFKRLELLDLFGSSGRIRTYNPSVNSSDSDDCTDDTG
jgi:hypothetical protein